jgi:hypothetical protein
MWLLLSGCGFQSPLQGPFHHSTLDSFGPDIQSGLIAHSIPAFNDCFISLDSGQFQLAAPTRTYLKANQPVRYLIYRFLLTCGELASLEPVESHPPRTALIFKYLNVHSISGKSDIFGAM